jgi:membrane-associated protease RseP (regulator of RpoE activity)
VAPGKVRIRVEHDEYATGDMSAVVEAPNREDRAFELPVVDLADAVSLSGVVLDAEGHAVAGARVAVEFLGVYVPRGAEPAGSVRTDAEGRFTLNRVASGNVTVFAMAAGRGRGELKVNVEAGRDVTDLELKLDASGAAEQVGPSGVAVTLGVRGAEGRLWIVHVAPNSEAERGGLSAGDEILSLDGERVTTLTDARERLSGQAGTDVVVGVSRRGATHDFRVRREDLASGR